MLLPSCQRRSESTSSPRRRTTHVARVKVWPEQLLIRRPSRPWQKTGTPEAAARIPASERCAADGASSKVTSSAGRWCCEGGQFQKLSFAAEEPFGIVGQSNR